MTAAALGSRLSVAGTILGAALASVIAAVASALYTASLKHTQDKVRTVWTGRTGDADVPTTIEVTDTHHRPDECLGSGPAERAAVGRTPSASGAQAAEAAELEEHRRRGVGGLRHRRRHADRLRAHLRSCPVRWRGHDHHPGQRAEERPGQKKPAGTATKSASPTAEPSSTASAEPEPSATASDAPAPQSSRDDQSADAVRLGHAVGEPDSVRDPVGRTQPLITGTRGSRRPHNGDIGEAARSVPR